MGRLFTKNMIINEARVGTAREYVRELADVMQMRSSIMERAFVLARSGSCYRVSEIRARLKVEGYILVEDFIAGKDLVSRLKQLCETASSVANRDADAAPIVFRTSQ